MNQKIASEIAVGVVLLIAIMFGGIFWLQNKKVEVSAPQTVAATQPAAPVAQTQLAVQPVPIDETADWQTYSNAKLGIEIKYPKSWSVEENFEKDGKVKGINNSYLTFKKSDGGVSFNLGIGDVVNDYLGQPTYKDMSDEHILIGIITFADVQLQKLFYYSRNNDTSAEIAYDINSKTNTTPKINGHDIFIRVWANSDNKKYNKTTVPNDSDLLEVDKILSTFKFTDENVKVSFDKNVLQDAVFSAVTAELKVRYDKSKDPGYVTWDKKVDITSVEPSLKAAKGKWWAHDAWDWIAWQQDDGNWKILLDFDGFNCKDLRGVPTQFNDFFKDIIYPVDGNGVNSKDKHCY